LGDAGLAMAWVPCAVGLTCAVASAASTVIGMLLQKLGNERDERFIFQLGVLIFTVCKPGFQIVALYFAPVALIAPMASVTILLNSVIVPWAVRSEKLGVKDLVSGAMLFLGCVFTMVSGPYDTRSWSYTELLMLNRQSETLTVALFAPVLLMSLALKLCPTSFGDGGLALIVVAFIPSAASALNNVMLKVMMEGLPSAPLLGLMPLVLMVGVSAFLQVWSTTAALQRFEMLKFVPIQTAAQILLTTGYGAVFFGDVPSNTAQFSCGILTTVVGVLLAGLSEERVEDNDKYRKLEDSESECRLDSAAMGA